MKAHHHASGDATVTYSPPMATSDIVGGPVDLASSAVCHFCGVTHISVLRPFPIPYRCSACADKQWPPPPAPPEAEPLTPAQAVLLTRIEAVTERMAKLTDRIGAERVRRDELFRKGQAQGLGSRRLGVPAGMSSPGVVSAIARAKERHGK